MFDGQTIQLRVDSTNTVLVCVRVDFRVGDGSTKPHLSRDRIQLFSDSRPDGTLSTRYSQYRPDSIVFRHRGGTRQDVCLRQTRPNTTLLDVMHQISPPTEDQIRSTSSRRDRLVLALLVRPRITTGPILDHCLCVAGLDTSSVSSNMDELALCLTICSIQTAGWLREPH